ncbi:EIIBCA-Bgl [Sebaldella termitidis]|uniref:Phosphotransferase system EIIC n=1 Tax=Sebaldella termitidis (strain ATCC 33386 / NCTC 11300) TaxID=526218 RepID=D1AFF9_SEBTE|nr:PTS transporter subunit EIIC [Sebaldella termitidis]ACZ07844.1 phosphotransferase system EIIC [Sebaldella termitidis ATCC 33386]SUI23144.1 EIIBCA-Bgl [Sebaldella termitidis]
MDKREVVKLIIQNVGGKENINNVWHCMTRLRLDLKDNNKINQENINRLDGIMGSQLQSDQYQIVIGTNVKDYYDLFSKEMELSNNTESQNDSKNSKKGIISIFMDIVSGVFGPIVPAIAGAGMIKGLLAGFIALKIISNESDTVKIIDMAASGVFTFLPFFLAVSAAKIFKTNQYLAAAIAACIMSPNMIAAAKEGAVASFSFLGFVPIPVFNYSGSVIPIIFAVWVLSYVYKMVDKVMPEVLKTVFTPTVTLFIMSFLTLSIIGPVGIYLGKGLAVIIQALFNISPVLAGLIVGAIRPVAILTGMHHAMTPIALQNFQEQGYDMLMPMMFMANMAITGATLAVYFKEKDKKEKSVILSSAISGLLGITEPALFGVLTKYKKAFLAATIGSSAASAFIAFFGVRIYGYILSSIFSLPAYIGPYFPFAVAGILIAIILSCILSYVFVVKGK